MEPDNKLEEENKPDEVTKQESVLGLFIKVGIVVLSVLLIIGFGIKVLPGAVSVSNTGSKRLLPIYCVDTTENKVALSFEVDSGNDGISEILAILDLYKIRATFFVTGEWVSDYPEDVKAIASAGHDLGNHSQNHRMLQGLTDVQCAEEIMTAHDKVKELTGIEMNLFRAPYGEFDNMMVQTAKECGYDMVQWNVDSEDWKDYGVKSIFDTVVNNKNLGNGSIILMHNGTKYTPEALGSVIEGLQAKGYRIVPISQLIYSGEYTVDGTGRQFKR